MKRHLRTRFLPFLLLFALALPLAAPANAQISGPAPTQEKPLQYTLPNGLTVIVKPDRRAPTAVHMLYVRVGAMDEVDGTTGVAHVLEHMLFKGTPTTKAGEFSRRVAALGGRENAFTTRDNTGYFQQIPAGKLEDVIKLEADRFAHNQWPDDEFKRELEVVKEERRMRTDDNPRSQLHEQLSAVAYQASPYRRPVVGWMSDLEAMTPQDARDFYRRWYVPANAAVIIAGDVDASQVKRLVEKYYGSIPARAVPPRKPREEPAQVGIRRLEFKAPADQSYVTLAFKVPQLSSFDKTPENDDALALTVLAAVLDGYEGARLDRALTRGADRIADSVDAGNGLWGRGPQMFTLSGVPAAGKSPEQVEAALREQVTRVAREGVTDSELQRVKTRWIAGEIYKLDSVMGQARELGTGWVMGLPIDSDDRLMARLREVTAAQVKSVAERYFGDEQLSVGILRPLPVDPNRKPRQPAVPVRH
jgi:zinc protease